MFLVGVVAVLLQKLGLVGLVLGRRHTQPQWQCLLVDHGIGQCDCPAKVGGRRLFDDGVQPILQGTGAQAHGLQVIHAFHDRVVVAVYSVIQQVLINTLQRALAKCLMGLAQAERQIFQQAQAVDRVRQALGDFIAQGVDRGKDFVAQARGPEQRLARALRVDTAALGAFTSSSTTTAFTPRISPATRSPLCAVASCFTSCRRTVPTRTASNACGKTSTRTSPATIDAKP